MDIQTNAEPVALVELVPLEVGTKRHNTRHLLVFFLPPLASKEEICFPLKSQDGRVPSP